MSGKKLQTFLEKLHNEMQSDSEDYRKATGNRKKTTLTHKNHKIRNAIKGLIKLNNAEAFDKKGTQVKKADDASITPKDLNALIAKLTESLRTLFSDYASGKSDVEYKKLRGGFALIMEAVEGKDGALRSNYKIIQDKYRGTINDWYTEFLAKIDRPEGLKRKSGSSNEIRNITSGGEAFNLTHEGGSNVLHRMNDAVYGALDETYGDSSDMSQIDSELKKYLDLKEYKTFLEITKNGRLGEVNVSISSALVNAQQGAGKLEQGLMQRLNVALGNAIERLGGVQNLDGSDSLTEAHRKKLVKEMVKPFKNKKGIKLKHENLKIEDNTSPEKISKSSKAQLLKMGAKSLGKKKQLRKRAARKPAPPKMSLANILGVLNNQLPKTVANNMGSPRLENQTGRFAQSVRAIDVTTTAQGFPSIGYTYMKERYGPYESTSGTRFSDVDRDPRPLIDQSIREIVIGFGLGRLYTRRL